jgi:HAMP domain-containing protein
MKPKILLVAVMFVVLLAFSLILRNNLAVGQNAIETAGQNTQADNFQQQILDKLDQVIANQNNLLGRLDTIEALIENTRVRATR